MYTNLSFSFSFSFCFSCFWSCRLAGEPDEKSLSESEQKKLREYNDKKRKDTVQTNPTQLKLKLNSTKEHVLICNRCFCHDT
jgi:hypothetical protein